MTYEQLGTLLEAFTSYYWSVSLDFVLDKITMWHPEVTARQIEGVLKKSTNELYWHHFCVVDNLQGEPELVVEHLLAVDETDFPRFLETRLDLPFCERDEEALLRHDESVMDIPEVKAMVEFGTTELGLDEEWNRQLIDDCVLFQPSALYNRESWVMAVLASEQYGKIRFRTIEQVRRFRELGNRLYQALPNPLLRGWRPMDIENAPVPLDDIPERDEDIPDMREKIDAILAALGGREKAAERFLEGMPEDFPKRKVGPNEPCPCGSGKKYKKCCGR